MSSPAKAKPEGLLGLSVSEAKVLLLGILCIGDTFKVDFEKLASKGGYTAGSAYTLFRNAKRKLIELNDNAAGGEASSSKAGPNTPKKTPAKRKKAAAEDSAAQGEDGTTPTKPKRQRKTPAKKNAAVKMDTDVNNGNGTAPKPKPESLDFQNSIKPEHDEVMDDAELDAELDAMDRQAQRGVKAEDIAV